ncbi:MAG: HpcH/HpaI aldolase family protein [Oscillospiraceae bacterium]|jgi:hypothetical protein
MEEQFALNKALLERLNRGETLIGTHITCNDPLLTELIGNAGFDYLWIDTEHTYIEKTMLINHLIAARACRIPAFVRIPWNDQVLAKPILDMGADGLIFPMIKTPEDAAYAVRSCLYPPYGVRGFGPRRSTQFGKYNTAEYVAETHKNILKLVQIETREAVENIDAIANTPGVGVIVIGPMDLSGAFGKLAQTKDPEIRKVYRYVAEHARAAGKPVLVSTGGYDPENIRFWASIGVNMITVGNEPGYIGDGLKTTLKNFRSVMDELKK